MTLSVAFSYLFGWAMGYSGMFLGAYAARAFLCGDFMERLLVPALFTLWILTAMAFFAWAA